MAESSAPAPGQRLDLFLWFARLARTRAVARTLATQGHLRIDGRRVERAHVPVRPGNVISFPLHGRVRVIRVEALPARRGPSAEAQGCYTDLLDDEEAAKAPAFVLRKACDEAGG